ncbi:hypothetical protein C9374_003637 [Naegleria lovaniensis]|uniref:Uncharacterized protein n=1 Tax=Naegleria lovaniensis TaxID=51637 RepID=A0AA88GZG8_NAELO|nr:uncharacterized protein C9374_003637 [Naegleria lovaniensis]KAG2393873.1 hypothetical protein C9374_003637 [Naegleria lovaniensis]
MSATTIYYNYNTQEWNDDKVTIVDCSKDFMHPMIIRNGTVSSTKMNFIRGATQEETGEWFNTISTLQVDLRKFVLDESHRYLIGHSSGSDTLVADNVVSNITSGITQAFWIIYSQSSQISRMIKIGSVSRNTKFYLYTLDYFFIHGLRRVGFAGELPAPYISIADNNYKPNEHLMIFQFSVSQVNAQPTVNKIAELPPPLFVPPRISIPTIMGSVPIVIVKDIVYGNDATLYFTGVFNTKIQFLDILTTIDSKKESSVFFGVLDPNNGTVVFITKIEPTLAIEYNSVNVNLMEISSNYQEIYITGTVQTFLEDVGFVQKVFIASYDISQPSAPVLRWNHIIGIDGAKSIDDIICLNGKLIINVLLANFSNVVTQISTQDGAFISALLIYDSPYFGVRTSLNADKDLVVVGKKGNVFANIDWDSFITFGVPSSVTLFSQKFKINTIQNSDELILEEVYREPILKGSIIATQSITLTTDTYNPRKFYVATTFSGSVQVIGDSNARINPVGFSNALISTIIEGCDTCESECIIPLCGPYTQDDSRACSGRGRCDSPNSCSCSLSTFSGETCQYPICFGVPQNYTSVCSGNGRCAFHDYCVCNDGYSGTNCEIARCFGLYATNDSVCSSHGDCVANDICKCFYNYTGEQCSFEIVQGYTHCGVGNYLYNQSSADRFVSPIMLYGFPPSLYISFDAHGQISYTGYGISPTLHSLGNGISVKFGSVLNASSELYSSILLIDQNNTLQEGIVVTSVTSDDYSNTWIVGWKQLQVFGLTQFIGVLIKIKPDGTISHIKEFGNVIPESVRLSADSSMIFITGGYRGSVEIDSGCTATSSSLVNTIVFQLSSFELFCLWMTTSEGMSKGFSVLPDAVDNVVISGIFRSAVRFEDKQILNTDPTVLSYYILKFSPMDLAGNRRVLWIQSITTNSSSDDNMKTSDEFFTSEFSSVLKFDPNRNILFSGEFGSFVSFQNTTVTSQYDRNFFLTKTDSNGFLQSMLTFQNVYNTSFDVDSSGYTYVTGVIKPGGSNIGDPNEKQPRFFAAKYCVRNHERWYKERPLDSREVYASIYSAYSEMDRLYVVAFVNKTLPSLPTIYTIMFKDEECRQCPIGTFSPNTAAISNDTCLPCEPGYYSDTEGAPYCTACPATTYNPLKASTSNNSCLYCDPGYFNDQEGQSACFKCDVGTYAPTKGARECLSCDPGTYAPKDGLSSCLPCPPGQYSDKSGEWACESCPTGHYQPLYGQNSSESCLKCLPGSFSSSVGNGNCTLCPAGFYNPNPGSSTALDCIKCPSGQYSSAEGSSQCTECDVGTYNENIGSSNASSCLPCTPGTFSNRKGQASCTKCAAGTYLSKSGSFSESDCLLCPIGFYSNMSGSSFCFSCPTGSTTSSAGSLNSTACIACEKGFFLNKDHQCTTCPFSTYSDIEGAIQCSICPLSLPTFTERNTSVAACMVVPIIIIVSLIVIIAIAIPLSIFGFMFRRQAVALKRKKRAEDEMLSKLLEHNTKSFYASTDTTTHQTANLIPIEDLEFKERVSEGAGGVIFRAAWKGTEVAVKRIKSNQFGSDDDETFEHEASILIGLRHPNVVLMMGVSVDEDNKYIITEFVKGGSLDKLIYNKKKAKNEIITFGRKLEILKDICRALIYLHNTRPPIIHRDLKPQNVLLDEAGLAKVCDFGVSKPLSSLTMTGVCYGTIQYTSPEILKQSRRYTTKCDVYSFAILMYELFFMVHPYSDLPKCPVSNHTKKSLAFLTSSNSDSSSPHLSDSYSGSGNSGDTTNNTSDMISIFAIGNDVIHGKRPMIPWENTLPSLQQQPHARPILQIQSSPTNLDSTILDVNSPTIIDEDVLKLEWYLHCNKTVKNSEITKPESLVPIIDSFISIMKACWANDDTERPDFSQILDSLEQLHKEWTEVLNSQ